MDQLANTIATVDPADLFLIWCAVDSLEEQDELSLDEACLLKHQIFRRMLDLGLEPDDLVDSLEDWALEEPTH